MKEQWNIEYVDGGARCGDCGRFAQCRVNKNGWYFYLCDDCLAEYDKEENEVEE